MKVDLKQRNCKKHYEHCEGKSRIRDKGSKLDKYYYVIIMLFQLKGLHRYFSKNSTFDRSCETVNFLLVQNYIGIYTRQC